MKITWKEVRELEDFIQRLEDDVEEKYVYPKGHPDERESVPWWFFADHPHFLITMGFDEYIAFANRKQFKKMWFEDSVEDTGQSLYRRPNGQWLLLFSAPNSRYDKFSFHSKKTLHDDEKEDEGALSIKLDQLFDHLYDIAGEWISEEKTLWHPNLWTPRAQDREKIALVKRVRELLVALHQEKAILREISWQQLEEIVAEVLRVHGMEIHLVRSRPQGGRDIIARGELIPGQEPLEMAIEVKHRKLVDRPQTQKALWQNRHFPALLFVTSGRFTAGVYREKALPENQLRLFLKDGVALGDMIDDYVRMLTIT